MLIKRSFSHALATVISHFPKSKQDNLIDTKTKLKNWKKRLLSISDITYIKEEDNFSRGFSVVHCTKGLLVGHVPFVQQS